MAKFLKGNELNSELDKVFEEAYDYLILVSPYIKLHDRYKATLLTAIDDPQLEIVIVFGKNESDLFKSINKEDLDFFTQFPNIQIFYEKRLHAKFYANEHMAILSSMNLYDYSQNNNIEAGILMESSDKGIFGNKTDLGQQAWDYFDIVVQQAVLIFDKEPQYSKKYLFGSKNYDGSKIKLNRLSEFFGTEFETRPLRQTVPIKKFENTGKMGYCIRTGKEIPFNIEKPMDYEAFKMWNKYKNPDYEENYCHFSGEPSDGHTSVKQPVLKKNWKKAKQKYNL
tara:strand:- start:93394 stop:94239 length:846 start_codon:yes stop_codon:yes gene_type:complete